MPLDPQAALISSGFRPNVAQGFQSLTPRIFKYLSNLDVQHKNRFDFLLFRNPINNAAATNLNLGGSGFGTIASGMGGAALGLAGLGIDLVMGKVYVESISFPHLKIVGERVNGDVYTKDLEYPETVNITFIEDEKGLVIRYLEDWMNDVCYPASLTDSRAGYVFRDDQESARRTGMLLPAGKRGKFPSTYPRIMFYGLFPRTPFTDIKWGQAEDGNQTYNAEFYVRDIRIPRIV